MPGHSPPRARRRARADLLLHVGVGGALLVAAAGGCDAFGGGGDDGCGDDGECGHGMSCEVGACVVGERCGDTLCDDGAVCGDDACVVSPYDQDYVLVVFSAHSTTRRAMQANLTLGGTKVVNTGASDEATDVIWNASVTTRVGAWEAFEVLLYEPGSRSLLRENLPRVPVALLRDGEMTFGDASISVTVRAWPVGHVPECLVDAECAGGEHCQGRTCAAGDRCGSAICGDGQLCGDGACVADTFGAPYTLTLVSAKLADGQWDTGFDGTPDPVATVTIGDEVVLEGPEQVDTYQATWNIDVTRVFDPYLPLRVRVVDVDVQGGDLAIDTTYPRFPYALVRDGTLTIAQGNSNVTLSLSR